jgi:hypothetical protein
MVDIRKVGPGLWCVSNTTSRWTKYLTQPGDISSVTVFGRPLIILNSVKIAMEMLEKKSSKYSDRPVMPMGGELGAPSQSIRRSELH